MFNAVSTPAPAAAAVSVRRPRGARSMAALAPYLVLAVVVVGALLLRWSLLSVTSGDYRAFLDPWYRHLADNGGFAALEDNFSNYNTPYLTLLAAVTYLPIPEQTAIKSISIVFDLVLALFAYLIIRRLRRTSRWLPVLGTAVVLFLPTVVMNGSAWGQCDSIYVSLCAASLYCLMSRKPWLATALWGLDFAFKLQAVFFLPVLVLLLIINKQRLISLVAAPVTFFLALVPALAAGRSLISQLMVYPAQISDGSGTADAGPRAGGGAGGGFPRGGGGGFPGGGNGGGFGGGGGGGFDPTSGYSYTYNAPTPYAWLPDNASIVWKYAGLGLAAAVALAFGIWLLVRRRRLSAAEMLLVAATATLVVPILLPEMHERYFYLAEIMTVLACFVDRRFVAVAAAIQFASITTYAAYLDNARNVPLEVAAIFALGAGITAAVVLLLRLRQPRPAAARLAATPAAGAVSNESDVPGR